MITEIFVAFNAVTFGADGDVVDRLHHKYTVYLLLFLALFLTTDSLVGQKIKCFVKMENPGSWNTYLDKYCWVKNTYYVDPDIVDISGAVAEGNYNEITYYQWAAIILCLSAVCFYLPCKLWHFISEKAGIDINHMITTCCNFKQIGDDAKREATYKNLAKYVDRFLDNQDNETGTVAAQRPALQALHCCSRQSGNYLGFGYIVTKFVYLLNVMCQFFFMTIFMGNKTSFVDFGFSVTNFITQGMVWEDQTRFPRMTYCDWTRDDLDKKVTRTVQCLLPQNIYIEKFFIIVWWWYLMLFVVTVLSIVSWFLRIYGAADNVGYVKKFLQSLDKYPSDRVSPQLKRKLRHFVQTYLKQDGVFVIRLVSKNVSSLMVSKIVAEIWDHFIKNYADEMKSRGGLTSSKEFPDDDTVPIAADDSGDDEENESRDSLDDYAPGAYPDLTNEYSEQPTAPKHPPRAHTEE